MSIGIWVETPGEGENRDVADLTYNLTPMLRKAFLRAAHGRWIRDFHGMPASSVAPLARAVLDELVWNPAVYRALEPDNGWGTYDDAVTVMLDLWRACAEHIDGSVRVD